MNTNDSLLALLMVMIVPYITRKVWYFRVFKQHLKQTAFHIGHVKPRMVWIAIYALFIIPAVSNAIVYFVDSHAKNLQLLLIGLGVAGAIGAVGVLAVYLNPGTGGSSSKPFKINLIEAGFYTFTIAVMWAVAMVVA